MAILLQGNFPQDCLGSQKFIKTSSPVYFKEQMNLRYLFLVACQTAKYIFLQYIYIEIRSNVLATNACGYDVIRETAKS